MEGAVELPHANLVSYFLVSFTSRIDVLIVVNLNLYFSLLLGDSQIKL